MIVRAGIEDSIMVDSLGINVDRVFTTVFGIGAMAAGFAGIVNAPVVSLTPEVGEAIFRDLGPARDADGPSAAEARCSDRWSVPPRNRGDR
jgi:hypothetical protein